MKRLRNHLVGVDQGETLLFSEHETGGAMWTGEGPREAQERIAFSERFREPPAVSLHLTMWDIARGSNSRTDLRAEGVTEEGFTIVFGTWGDTRIARVRVAWQAIGELPQADDWEL